MKSQSPSICEAATWHRFFGEILDLFPKEGYASIARAIGRLHQEGKITQHTEGKYQPSAEA